jgi:hypothetical protein
LLVGRDDVCHADLTTAGSDGRREIGHRFVRADSARQGKVWLLPVRREHETLPLLSTFRWMSLHRAGR